MFVYQLSIGNISHHIFSPLGGKGIHFHLNLGDIKLCSDKNIVAFEITLYKQEGDIFLYLHAKLH